MDFEHAVAQAASALAEPGQPETGFRGIERALAGLVGHRLFTLLVTTEDRQVQRVYTSNPTAYPVGGRKAMAPTPWGELVLGRREPYLGRDPAAIRWAFPDHELIASLGLGATINWPVVYDGRVLGTMNLLDREGAYDRRQMELCRPFAALLVPAFGRLAA
ncbi:MAG: GAF domain-containing protein [Alphaproteobacteria bacterium]|nr:GAF domain-containing protein [Alphaproteobacteria bacterium]